MSAQKANTQASKPIYAVSLEELGVKPLEKPISTKAVSTWIRTLLQNWRQGTVKVKGRADVARTGKKPFKQKGTGRARAGTSRSPLWRGGGVIFGPQPRVRKLTLPSKVRKKVFEKLLHSRVKDNSLFVLEGQIMGDVPKTSQAYSLLKAAELHTKKIVLFIPRGDVLTYASFVNLPNVQLLFFDQCNAYDLLNADSWVVLKKDFDQFKKMVEQWT